MKIYIKKIILLLFVIATVFSLAACDKIEAILGEDKQDNSESEKEIANINKLYDQAKTLGYEGTLEDFIEVCKGENGKHGKDGKHGLDGVSIKNSLINEEGHLIFILSNGSTLDAGKLPDLSTKNPGVYKVTFNLGDGYTFEAYSSDFGIEKPEDPQKDGFTFIGWTYYEEASDSYELWRFGAYAVTCDMTLYALWDNYSGDYPPTESATDN